MPAVTQTSGGVPVELEHADAPHLEHARREALSLAWSTGFPQLVLPCLLEEKFHKANQYWTRQIEIRKRSALLLDAGGVVEN